MSSFGPSLQPKSTELSRRVPGSGLRAGHQTPSMNRSQKIGMRKPTIPPKVFDKWRHLLVMALAITVAIIGFEGSNPDGAVVASDGTATVEATASINSLPTVSLPTIASLKLPPMPIRNNGVKDPYSAAENVILVDATSHTVLYEKSADKPVPIASTTKIATAIVALEQYKNLEERVTISQAAATQIGSAVGFRIGETATIRELLYGLLMVSGNDAAYAIAEQLAKPGDTDPIKRFVDEMNAMARRQGAYNTHFADPAGLNDLEGRSTARDMAKLKIYALNFDLYMEIAGLATYEYISPEHYRHLFENSNWLIKQGSGFEYLPTESGKTGNTPKLADGTGAGHCLVSSAVQDGHRLIAVVFDTYDNTAQASAIVSRKLFEYGFANFTWQSIVR